jgi:myotubularin-related protein 6/7/8
MGRAFGEVHGVCVQKMITAEKMDKDFGKGLSKSVWSNHIENILKHAELVYKALHDLNGNVLIYCETGSNGSSLLSSLAQIFCDPYYRTFEGFKVLVHKEWVFYKHNFAGKN